jgi:hypothetical protein
MSCPFTIQDVLRAKKFGDVELGQDFNKLVDFPADTNPKKFCGNKILYHYQFENLLKCKREKKGYKTLYELAENPDEWENLWMDTVKRNRRKKGIDGLLAIDMYETHRLNKGAIVFFKPSTAKYIYKLFNAKNVLDPTAGWGGRMLGAMSLGINYTGIDTNINLKSGYDSIMSEPWFDNDGDIKMIWEDCQKVDYSKIRYDLVLTSPPYVNMEIYEHCPLFNPKTFYKEWLIPLMDKLFEHLELGGHMCFNISPKMFDDLIKSGYREPDSKIDMRQQMGQNSQVKSQDYIYVWSKIDKNLKMDISNISKNNNMEALKKELDAVREINFMLMKNLKDIKSEEDISKMMGLPSGTGIDVGLMRIAKEKINLYEENEKLKQELCKYMETECELSEEICYLKKENEKLKENIHALHQYGLSLQEENEKLKEAYDCQRKILGDQIVALQKENIALRDCKNQRTQKMGKIIHNISKQLEELKFEVSLGDLLERVD